MFMVVLFLLRFGVVVIVIVCSVCGRFCLVRSLIHPLNHSKYSYYPN
jgi:hypothetical protein